jgi:D-alanyl-lipoteichoic acid acyltransferase DltB (MBOAT superfamily)
MIPTTVPRNATPRLADSARELPRVLAWALLAGILAFFTGPTFVLFLAAMTAATFTMAVVLGLSRGRAQSRPLLVTMCAAHVLLFAAVSLSDRWDLTRLPRAAVPLGIGVWMCHAIAFLVDVHRGDADTRRPLRALLYLLQLPVIAAGPLSRYHEFTGQMSRAGISLGAFAYGMRRVVTGFIKAFLVGGTLASTADAIFAAQPARLSAGAAWLGACCASLHVYLQFSGFCDMAIGVGRMVGLRYPENFRRPYTADSIREFWRRWNVTLITWLRDYLSLPIAGHDRATPRTYVNIIAGFCLVGLWHRGSWMFLLWGIYCGTWLALEEIGLRAAVARWPRAVRHAYVLGVVTVGWTILRAPHPAAAGQFLHAMTALARTAPLSAGDYLTAPVWLALAVGAFAAGPLVPSISRWRVSIDAATTSVLMMAAATGVFLWRGPSLAIRSVWPAARPRL